MESEDRGFHYVRQTSYHSHFPEGTLGSGYAGPELGSTKLGHFRVYDYPQHHLRCYPPPLPFLPSHPRYVQHAIQNEFEKEQIRNEIIMYEIARRRALEAEVRRELMMEREWPYRQGSEGLIYGRTLTVGFDSSDRPPLLRVGAEQWSPEERTVQSLIDSERPSDRYETTSRQTEDLRISEVNPVLKNDKEKVNPPVSENGREKERISLQAKHDVNMSGSKRKVERPPLKVADTEFLSDGQPLRKKAKTEWNCAICEVSTTSERALKDHLQGKKHKAKEAAKKVQVSGKNYCIGFSRKKATQPVQVVGTPIPENGQKLTPAPLLIEKSGNANSERDNTPTLQNQNSKDLKKNGQPVVKEVPKIVPDMERCKFWCEMCKVGAFSENVMNNHKKGKKHVARLQQSKEEKFKYWCEMCKLGAFSEDVVNNHKKGKKHIAQLQENTKEKFKYWCEMCEVGVFSEDVMNNHKRGKKHTAQLLMSKEEKFKFWCEMCKVGTFSEDVMNSHK